MTVMADVMNFPKRWEDFLHDYEFEDARRIYTNGSRLIPSFRVKQMMEHYAPVVHGKWMHEETEGGLHIWRCNQCGRGVNDNPEGVDLYCYHCGAKMDGSVSE